MVISSRSPKSSSVSRWAWSWAASGMIAAPTGSAVMALAAVLWLSPVAAERIRARWVCRDTMAPSAQVTLGEVLSRYTLVERGGQAVPPCWPRAPAPGGVEETRRPRHRLDMVAHRRCGRQLERGRRDGGRAVSEDRQ